ncbi:MAG: hypothetical protein EA359_01120 [Balneolaceae bacterium]|nr:MAG: hypothetical protein EA359_01120 [Balneolaceae bacterium]
MDLRGLEGTIGYLSNRDTDGICREWYAFCVKPRHEKKTGERLRSAFEIFCPMKEERVRWSDRWKTVISPWLPGYLFARVTQRERYEILNDPSVHGTLCINGKPAPIRVEEIELLKTITGAYGVEELRLLPVSPGDKVRIRTGKLMNLNGVVVRVTGKKASIHLDSLKCQLVVTLSTAKLEFA